MTQLLSSASDLEREIQGILDRGDTLDTKLMIEFCDTSDQEGIFRKYSAYNIGGRIIPSMVSFRPDWHVKASTDELGVAMHPEKVAYLKANPHQAELREIFRLAGIDYGRMDYALLDGKVQTWEINTNPDISGICTRPSDPYNTVDGVPFNLYLSALFEAAFAALDDGCIEQESGFEPWHLNKLEGVVLLLEDALPSGSRVLWAGDPEAEGASGLLAGRDLMPFLEQKGQFWGPPPDDATAIRELERSRRAGAQYLVFVWSNFWWLEYYPQFHQYLETRFPLVEKGELVYVYNLSSTCTQ